MTQYYTQKENAELTPLAIISICEFPIGTILKKAG